MSEAAPPLAPVVGVGVIVVKGDSVLLIRRGNPPNKGAWSIPGGRQELGETVRETAVREVREETGLDIVPGPMLDVFDGIGRAPDGSLTYHYTLIDFAARWQGGDPVAGGDAAHVEWVPRERVAELDLWSETRRVIEMAFERLQS